ncbi:hypothetical protein NEAUS04_2001 [Nematocida ausubeli]|nr:hypothetical protein NEAUS04_2001 [Nematocida ausubeli]
MYIGEYIRNSLEVQFRNTYLRIRNLCVYRLHKKSYFSAILNIIYNIILTLVLFSSTECMIYFFFGSLPIYSFSELYYRLRPAAWNTFDKDIMQFLYLMTAFFCIFFELFVQVAIFQKLVVGYLHTVMEGSFLNYAFGFLFYLGCIILGCALHLIVISELANLLDLIRIKTLLGKVAIGAIIAGLLFLMIQEYILVNKAAKKKKKTAFTLRFYMSLLVVSIIMMLIWFGIDLGIPLYTYISGIARSEMKNVFNLN